MGFTTPCKFKDGDIIFTCALFSGICSDYLITGLYYTWISIFHKMRKDQVITYVDIENSGRYVPFWMRKGELCRKNDITYQRLATEEEKERLFKYIKDNGYKWNAETKTLEELVEPKFKVGDRIRCKNGVEKYDGFEEGIIDTITDNKYGIVIPHLMGIVSLINITDQDNWELVALKFKTGDRIRRKIKRRNYIDEGEIKSVSFNFYDVFTTDEKSISIPIREQDEWELVPDKIKPKFKDGDIISDSLGICIFKREGNHSGTVDFYCGRDYIGNLVIKDSNKPDSHFGNIVDYKFRIILFSM